MNYSAQLDELKNEAISEIIEKVSKLKSGFKVLKEPVCILWPSCDSGYFEDIAASVYKDGSVYFVEEGREYGKDYNSRYDFKDDEDFICSSSISLSELPAESLFKIADAILGAKSAFVARFIAIRTLSGIALEHIEEYKNLSAPVFVNIDYNGNWFCVKIAKVKKGSVLTSDGAEFMLDDDNLFMSQEDLICIASAV